jgi:hypothetical protein
MTRGTKILANCTLAFCLTCLLIFSGCVWLRLLELKKQCASPEEYFEFSETRGLTISAKKPVLFQKDFRRLGLAPTSTATVNGETVWILVFQKILPSEHVAAGDFNLILTFRFTNKKVRSVHISENYSFVMQKRSVITMMRSIGDAGINKRKKEASVQGAGTLANSQLAYRADALRMLGMPYGTEKKSDANVLVYKYELDTATAREKEADVYWVRLTYDNTTGRLLFIRSDLPIGTIAIDYSEDPLDRALSR